MPVEETVRAFDALVREGKVRHVAMSNTTGERLQESLELAEREGLAPYVWLQPHYNLVEREGYESEFAPIVASHGLAVAPYYALASGFLTGKYRNGADGDSPRAERRLEVPRRARRARAGGAGRGRRRARRRRSPPSRSRGCGPSPGVAAPIASARTPEQLRRRPARRRRCS